MNDGASILTPQELISINITMSDRIIHDHNHDGLDRRGFLKCMAWAGTGALWVVSGGILRSQTLNRAGDLGKDATAGDVNFVQISPTPPAFFLHTGDLSHLSKPEEFDALDQLLKSAKTDRIFYVPGEHDVLTDKGAIYQK